MAENRVEPPNVRELAAGGRLAGHYGSASPVERRRLWTEAYALLHVLVFVQLTRRVEARRGHRDCRVSVSALRPDCLDRFQDDMEAVLHDLFQFARTPIQNLEGWVSSRLTTATIDGHRRRRGQRGALQRPRLPRWLADELGHDKVLMALALDMLEWVGMDASAGIYEWPIGAWSAQRMAEGTDHETANRSVEQDVATVVNAMSKRPRWYSAYIERPMGRKRLPVAMTWGDASDPVGDPDRAAQDADTADDARRAELAYLSITLIQARLNRGEEARGVIVDVLSSLFGSGTGSEDLGRAPGLWSADDERVMARLADPEAIDRIVAVVLDLVLR